MPDGGIDVLIDTLGSAGGTLVVVVFLWRKIDALCRDVQRVKERQAVVMAHLGVYGQKEVKEDAPPVP